MAQVARVDVRQYTPAHRAYYRSLAALKRVPLLASALRVVLPFIPFLVLWELVVRAEIYPRVLFPSPLTVAQASVELARDGTLWEYIGNSLFHLLLGFIAGFILAVPLGILMGINRGVAQFFDPIVNLLQAIPGLAWAPLAILWLGLSAEAVTFIIFNATFFPLLFNMLSGVRSTDQSMVDASLTLGAQTRHIVRDVILPGSLPSLITGIRLGVGHGFRALVGAEMIIATSGIGFMIFDARRYLRSDIVILGMILMGVLWLLMDRLALKPIERRTVERWGLVREVG